MKIFKNDSLILTRYYFSDYEEEHYADGRVRKIDYITGPTGLVGVRISTNGTDSLLHAFTDRFGNLVMLVDGDKNIVDRLAYDPWGARRNPDDWTKPDTASHLLPRGYSMHEHLDCLGLINMNARVYEPATCSFLSPDPLIADENNWLNYNRYLYCLGNPVKFADPTGMQVDNYYDVEGVLPRFVPQPIYEPEESFRYIVTDNSWEEQAMATVRFNNAMYELNKVITAGTNNALAFIDHDRNAAVQRALANAAMASAQADAATKAAGDAGRNALGSNNCYAVVVNGDLQMVETPKNPFTDKKYNGHSIVDMGSMISGSIGISTAWTEQALAGVGVDLLRNCGTAGKVMGGASVGLGIVGLGFGVWGGHETLKAGNQRGWLDMGVAIAGGGTAIAMTIGIIGSGGWMVVIPCAIYGFAVGVYDW